MIKNIIFDLGGVLLDIDFDRTLDAFHKLGIENVYDLDKYPEVLELFMALERGAYTPEGFRKRFRVMTGFRGCDDHLDSAFNALLLGFAPDRIARVMDLNKKYNTFILSNTNAIHCEYYNQMFYDHYGMKNLDQLVKKAYYSHEMDSRKPEKEIYLKMIADAGIRAEESLFIDDRQDNLDTAAEVGLQTMLVDEERTIMTELGGF